MCLSLSHIYQQLHTFYSHSSIREHSANEVIAGRPWRSLPYSGALWNKSMSSVGYSDSQRGLVLDTCLLGTVADLLKVHNDCLVRFYQ